MISALFSVVFSILVGAAAGYVAGRLMVSAGSSPLHNIILGMVGGFVGSFLLGLIGLHSFSFIGDFVVSVAGACVCIWAARKLSR